ncbi:dockerin type I repeat-containing protein [Ruminococcus albus]|uniref:Dockerin domain-containing protein n=1 Tax=Ruminococcus albus TaxID=1264 RepID=A0A1I1G5I9_RUMAL|nr:dockerin type I repeat-containing protein [Ruminococcus albus]SFC05078.1 hypothetical protein SAMN02910406_01075 [Ruminococcus albus]
MKRTAAFITALTMAASVFAISASALKGDVSGDGKVNVTDITLIAAHVKGKKLLSEEKRAKADVTGDGKVNISDITAVAAHVKGKRLLKENDEAKKRALVEYDFGQFKEAVGGKYEFAAINGGQSVALGVYNFDVFPNTYFCFGWRGTECMTMTESGEYTFDKKVFEEAMDDSCPVNSVQVVKGGQIADTDCVVGMKYSELKKKFNLGKAQIENCSLTPNIRTTIDGVNWSFVFNDEATREVCKNVPHMPDAQCSEYFKFEDYDIDPVCTYAISDNEEFFKQPMIYYDLGELKQAMYGEYDLEVISVGQAAGVGMYNDKVFPNLRFVFMSGLGHPFNEIPGGLEVDRENFESLPDSTELYAIELMPGAKIPGRGGAKVGMKYSELKEYISLGKAYNTSSEFSPVINVNMFHGDWQLIFADRAAQEAVKDINPFDETENSFSFEDLGVDPMSTRMIWFKPYY